MTGAAASLVGTWPSVRRILRTFRPHLKAQRRLIVGGWLALVAEVALRLLEPWPLKFVIDAVAVASGAELKVNAPVGLHTLLLLAAGGLVAVVAGRALASYLMTVCFAMAGNRVLTRVRAELYAHLHGLSLRFHEGARTGDLVTRVTGDVARLQEVAVTAAMPLLGNLVTLAAMLVVIAVLDIGLALLVVAVFPLFLISSVRLTRRIGDVSRKQRRAEGRLAAMATESLSAMKVVQTYSLEVPLQRAFGGSNARTLKTGVRGAKLAAGLERKTDLLVGLATALVLYVGARRVVAGALTPGELVVFLTYLKTAFKPMNDLAKYTARIAKAAASGDRIIDLLETRPDIADRPDAVAAPTLRGDVHFQDVEMAYDAGHPVLRGLTLTVPAGQRVAVVGPSGAGKSTLVALLSRLRDPDCGQVLLDGHDVRGFTVSSLRSQVAVVLQDSVLFAASVGDNIAYGLAGATREQVEAAARLAGAHEFVLALPQGYDTVVGERGETLSGGQRQRIAIARAAIRDAPIVVLDEALTGLDQQTEAGVVEALGHLTRHRTTFVITHDLTAARDADRVIWLEAGRVVRDGSPEQVLLHLVQPGLPRPGAIRAVAG